MELRVSNSNNYYHYKRQKLEAKFKGVVPQQNGLWGAQIYANHQRIWLGTFKSEKEAAMAYDSATIKLRNEESYRNFPITSRTVRESCFQERYSAEEILEIIRDGSYEAKFNDFLKIESQLLRKIKSSNNNNNNNIFTLHGDEHVTCKQLFQKELTPSDVGKLNRLVVPKKYAVKYFPYVSEYFQENVRGHESSEIEDVEFIFYDKMMKLWKFRYCYWRSSQSFVFTRGWNRFVKEKNLKEKDVIKFYLCERRDTGKNVGTFNLIDVCYENNKGLESEGNLNSNSNGLLELELSLGKGIKEGNGFRLFGVQIN